MAKYVESVANADYFVNGSKIKTPFATIIVGGSAEKPCYSILWWDEADKECNIGFSSYYLDFVFKWLEEEFEIVDKVEDVAPVVHGEWIPFHSEAAGDIQYCSACDVGCTWKPNYCPNCGARMDGE